jgi:acyl carrier protein
VDTIAAAVRKVIAEVVAFDIASVMDDNTLVDDLELDSIELVELAQDLEEEFDIEIPDSAITAAMTVGQVVDAVKNLKGVTS